MKNDRNSGNKASDEEIDLTEIVAALIQGKYIILLFAAIFSIVGILVVVIWVPTYQAAALVQIEKDSRLELTVFEKSLRQGKGGGKITSYLEIIKSRMIIAPIVDKLDLNINVVPKYFPIIGAYKARKFEATYDEPLAPPFLGLSAFAWGGEKVVIDYVSVPKEFLGEIYKIKYFDDRYEIYSSDGILILIGQVGFDEQSIVYGKNLKGEDLILNIRISEFIAREGTEFFLSVEDPIETTNRVIEGLEVYEKGRDSGLIELVYAHSSKLMARDVVNAIAKSFYDQDLDRASSEAEKSISFLEKQIPILKKQLDSSEDKYKSYRENSGSVDFEAETVNVLKTVTELEDQKLQIEKDIDRLKYKYKDDHPIIKSLKDQLNIVNSNIGGLNARVDQIPGDQQTLSRLERDVQVNNDLYTKLMSVIQELNVAKAGSVGRVRIIDYAVAPVEPSGPKKKLILGSSVLAGLFFGGIFSFLFMRKGGIKDPEHVEDLMGAPVIAHVAYEERIKKMSKKGECLLLRQVNSGSSALDGIKSIRTVMEYSDVNASNNVLLVTGPSPGVGKSFVSVNYAAALSELGKKVLVIDADFRKGTLSKFLDDSKLPGLNESLNDGEIRAYPLDDFGLYLMPSGRRVSRSTEKVSSNEFKILIEKASKEFDHVIIDSPPVLSVSDSIILSRYAGTVLFVIKYMESDIKDLQQSVKSFQHVGVNISGVVINNVVPHYLYGSKKQDYLVQS